MANEQTRVLLLNGQTYLVQGDVGDNSINEINADLLQQALQDASGTTPQAEEQPPAAEFNTTQPTEDNLVAIFQGEQGETHTIQLSVAQAEALGLHFTSDDGDKLSGHEMHQAATNPPLPLDGGGTQLLYPDTSPTQEEQKSLFDPSVSNQQTANLQDGVSLPEDNKLLQQAIGNLGMLQGINSYVGDTNNLTMVPQFVNGQVTFTLKVNQQNEDFPVLQTEGNNEESKENKLSLLAPLSVNPVNSVSNVSVSSAPLTTSLPNVRMNNISTVNTLPTMTQNIASVTTANNLPPVKASNTISLDKRTKTQYVLVPRTTTTTSTTNSSILAKPNVAQSQLLRSSARSQLLAQNKLISSTTTPTTSTTTTLTGIPIINSNINITRTSSASSGLLQSVSTTLTGGGMIRVVAGGASSRMSQTTSNNGPKFTNILTSSGRLVAATSATTATTSTTTTTGSVQRVLPANSTATVKTVAVTSNSTPVTPTTSESQTTVVPSTRVNFNSTKPLGSSENPIQLVQHGQTFHSVQALSQEQLRQIATVLQQQHLDSAPRTKNVLYDAETNTRIIYRVVYPEDLDLRDPSSPSERQLGTGLNPGRGRGRRGRPPKSSVRALGRGNVPEFSTSSSSVGRKAVEDLDEDRLLDDLNKGERKKQVARTRSGRLSRPPRHMVKDYKRLHHLDFADADLDDSDGGYSDYQTSDREVEDNDTPSSGPLNNSGQVPDATLSKQDSEPPASTTLLPGLELPKRKISSHFRCPTCQKIYLGHSRMARHLEMYPDHGSIDQLKAPPPPPAPSPPMPLPDSTQGKVGSTTVNGILRSGPARRRGKRRGPWAYTTPEARSERRKLKLREALMSCEATELSEVAGPAVARVLSTWEMLLLRVEARRAEESLMATLCDELRTLLEKVQAVAGEVLQPANCDASTKDEKLELQDETLCNALGLPTGHYHIVDDHLLSSRKMSLFETNREPSPKRVKTDEAFLEEQPSIEKKPNCPEVLSALALDPKPTICLASPSTSVTKDDLAKEPEMMEINSNESKTTADVPVNISTSIEDKQVDPEADDEHQFLLPSTSDMCVELTPAPESEQQTAQDIQTVDDIVNERLKNLTEFTVSGPENEPVEQGQALSNNMMGTLPQFSETHSNTVPTFDPEMALAAMGEGDQNVRNSSPFNANNNFSPEIALAAMGEGDQDSSRNDPQSSTSFALNAPVIQDTFSLAQNIAESCQTPATETETFSTALELRPVKNKDSPSNTSYPDDLTLHIMNQTESTDKTKEDSFNSSMLTNSTESSLINSLTADTTAAVKGDTAPSASTFNSQLGLGEDANTQRTQIASGSGFDPEIALASMNGSVSSASTVTTNTPQFSQQTGASSNESSFQLPTMDVSLDESGSDIDFETLSAEFCRTTQHS